MVHTSAVFSCDDFDVETLTADAVRFAVVLTLPFRVRTGKLFKAPSIDGETEIWLRNNFDIPEGTDFREIIRKRPDNHSTGWSYLWTEALIIVNHPKIQHEEVNKLKGGTTKGVNLSRNVHTAIEAINELIGAYSEAVNTILGGDTLRMLTDIVFLECVRLEITYFAPPKYMLTEKDTLEIFTWRPEKLFVSKGGQLTGDLFNLPRETLEKLPAYLKRFREHAFYELGFKAKSEMVNRKPIVALVLACAALEGAHAAYLRTCLEKPLGPCPKDREELINNLLREQGIYTLIRLTIYVFMPDPLRPPDEDLQKCLEGMRIRNDIMHAKRTKKGYKIREHTFKKLSEAYSGIFKVYRCFIEALNAG